jgi:beta-ketoacyl-acyl-carrier-protein synthase II
MSPDRVVITGIGLVTPLGLDTPTTWKSLLAGASGIDRITTFDTEGFETQIAAEVKGFDPTTHMDVKEARHTDRFSQFAVAASREAMSRAGLEIGGKMAERVAVLIGSGVGGILSLSQQYDVLKEKGPRRVSPFLIPMMLIDMAAARVSIATGAKGPNYSTVSACASGSDAIGEAYELIRRGEVDVALCGGAEAPICPIAMSGFNACNALSRRNDDPKGASRPFDADRDGFIIGEGAAVLVLERMEHAVSRGAAPLAELTGYAATSDAGHIVQPSPEGEGGARAIARAIARAGLRPEQVEYINAHGTSTQLNDRAETMAIKSVFGGEAYKTPISSTKSMTGHLLGAAGALEAAICVLAIKHGAIPPTINLDTPDPDCDLDYSPWTARLAPISVAISNSLGFGGHNSTLVFQRYQD